MAHPLFTILGRAAKQATEAATVTLAVLGETVTLPTDAAKRLVARERWASTSKPPAKPEGTKAPAKPAAKAPVPKAKPAAAAAKLEPQGEPKKPAEKPPKEGEIDGTK